MSVIHLQRHARAALAAARCALTIAVAVFAAPLAAAAGTVTIAWEPSPESEVRGYIVHVGTAPGVVAATVDVGNVSEYTYPNATAGVVYYFSVSAYGDNGAKSPRSSEITAAVRTVPAAPPLMSPLNTSTPATPTFTWAAVGGATSYLLKVSDAVQSGKILQPYTPAQAGCAAGTGTCSVTASIPLASGAATWTVQAANTVGAGPWSTAGAFTVGAAGGGEAGPIALIPRTGWRLHYVDSQEVVAENGAAANAFDGNSKTIWHTQYKGSVAPMPHDLQIDLGTTYSVSGFRYLARQDKSNGRIAKYEFYVSVDGKQWGTPVASGTLQNTASEQQIAFTATSGRYVRLRALSEVSGRAFTSLAELNLLGDASQSEGPQPIARTGWKLKSVDSEETVATNNAAVNAFDGNPNTIWHTQWKGSVAPMPHDLQIDLGASYDLGGFRYLPRQDGSINGRIAKYEFYVSADGVNWGAPAIAGTLANDASEKEVLFGSKTGRFVRLRALSEVNGRAFASMAELNVLGGAAAADDLALHLTMDEVSGTTAADASGHGRAGTLLNGAAWAPARVGGGVKLDGANDSIRVNAFDPGSTMTLALWVNIDSGRSSIQTLLSSRAVSGGTQPGFHLHVNNFGTSDRRLLFGTGNGTSGATMQTSDNAVASGWHHVAVVVNKTAGTGVLYVDGAKAATTGGLLKDFPTNLPLFVGRTGDGWALGGSVDDVRVYNRDLSASEIAALAK